MIAFLFSSFLFCFSRGRRPDTAIETTGLMKPRPPHLGMRRARLAVGLVASGAAIAFLAIVPLDDRPPRILSAILASPNPSPAPALQTSDESCDDWPSAKLDSSPKAPNTVKNWLCVGESHRDVMRHSRIDACAPADCKQWCLATHPVDQYQQSEEAGLGGPGWCCEWRALNGGQCAWSDGVAHFSEANCSASAEKGSSTSGCERQTLAFDPCLATTKFKRFAGGRCLRHRDVLIQGYAEASREECARLCAAQARSAQPGDLKCKVFGYFRKPDDDHGHGRRHHGVDACVLLDHCRVRPRESHTYTYYATPEGVPDVPALT